MKIQIIKRIKKYEKRKNKKEINIIDNINNEKEPTIKVENAQETEKELINEDFPISQLKEGKNKNHIIIIDLDNENEDEEEKKLFSQIKEIGGLEDESQFLKEFLYNDNFFNEYNIFFPENFDDKEIANQIINKNNENNKNRRFIKLRQNISLQLYANLKLVFPSLDNDIFEKNVIYLENLAKTIDEEIGGTYLLIIEMIFERINEEVIKINQKKNKAKNPLIQ